MPQLRPPVVRGAGEQASGINSQDHSPSACGVGDGVVAQRVANSDVAVDRQWHRDPDGGVHGRELEYLHCLIHGGR